MKPSESRRRICTILCASMCALLAAPVSAQSDSGFLKDYSQLKPMKDAKGTERRVWISDKVNWESYRAILVDRVEFHPKPDGTPQVTLGALYDIRDYLNTGLPKAVAANMPVATTAGPGVLRLRSAITAVSVDKSLKPYQLVPIALLFTAAKRSAGTAAYDVKLQAEFELLDSVTGEVLAAAVREAQGLEVHGDQPVTLKVAQPQLDLWLAGFQEELALRVKKPAAN